MIDYLATTLIVVEVLVNEIIVVNLIIVEVLVFILDQIAEVALIV